MKTTRTSRRASTTGKPTPQGRVFEEQDRDARAGAPADVTLRRFWTQAPLARAKTCGERGEIGSKPTIGEHASGHAAGASKVIDLAAWKQGREARHR